LTRRFYKNSLYNLYKTDEPLDWPLPWQPEFVIEFNSLNNLGRVSFKEHPCKVITVWQSGLGEEVV